MKIKFLDDRNIGKLTTFATAYNKVVSVFPNIALFTEMDRVAPSCFIYGKDDAHTSRDTYATISLFFIMHPSRMPSMLKFIAKFKTGMATEIEQTNGLEIENNPPVEDNIVGVRLNNGVDWEPYNLDSADVIKFMGTIKVYRKQDASIVNDHLNKLINFGKLNKVASEIVSAVIYE